VLGSVGRNFGAGMTNGTAYVLDDRDGLIASRCNLETVALTPLGETDERRVQGLIRQHYQKTGSGRARAVLQGWALYRGLFWKVAPPPPPALTVPSTETAPILQERQP